MNHATLSIAFYVSLVLGMSIGIAIMIGWAKRILKPAVTTLERSLESSKVIDHEVIGGSMFLLMLPGLIAFVLCCVPVIYFNYLLKQHNYCLQVIRVNKIKNTDDEFLIARCGKLDLDELLLKAQQQP